MIVDKEKAYTVEEAGTILDVTVKTAAKMIDSRPVTRSDLVSVLKERQSELDQLAQRIEEALEDLEPGQDQVKVKDVAGVFDVTRQALYERWDRESIPRTEEELQALLAERQEAIDRSWTLLAMLGS